MRKKWTEQEEEYLRKNFDKFSYQEIANFLGRPLASIENKTRAMNLKKNGWSDEQIQFLINNHEKMNRYEMSESLNKNFETLSGKCIELGLYRPHGVFTYPTNVDYFRTWSHPMAYILGFITADGCVIKNQLAIALSIKDVCILEFIKSELSPTRPLRFFDNIRHDRINKMVALDVISYQMYDSLVGFGLKSPKTGREVLPEIPDKYKGSYLLGLFDGDGSIYKHGKTYAAEIVSACGQFMIDVNNNLLDGFGSIYRKTKNINLPLYRLYFCSKKAMLKLYYTMYHDNTSFFLPRKRERFEDFLRMV